MVGLSLQYVSKTPQYITLLLNVQSSTFKKKENEKVNEIVGQGKHWFAGKLVPL